MRVVMVLLYLVALLMLAAVLFAGMLVVLAGWALRTEKKPKARVLRMEPPASRRQRLKNRLTTCLREGHVYRCRFPMGTLAQQCVECGDVAPRLVVVDKSFHVRRA